MMLLQDFQRVTGRVQTPFILVSTVHNVLKTFAAHGRVKSLPGHERKRKIDFKLVEGWCELWKTSKLKVDVARSGLWFQPVPYTAH